MDGMSSHLTLVEPAAPRRTLKAPIGCVGVGLHSGLRARMTLRPAPFGAGIAFRRTDLGVTVPARWNHVIDTRLCTVIGLSSARVGTVEHVLAALAGCGITDVMIDIDGPEVPALDGSACEFVFLIECAGVVNHNVPAPIIEVLRPVRAEHDGAWTELRPAAFGFDLTMSIAFADSAIGAQAFSGRMSASLFRERLAPARTFARVSDVAALHAAGLAQGGSLDNTVVVQGAQILNPAGLRGADEFVRHKVLDVVGDLALAGAALRARFIGHRSGHALNNQVLRALFADPANWRLVTPDTDLAPVWQESQLASAAD